MKTSLHAKNGIGVLGLCALLNGAAWAQRVEPITPSKAGGVSPIAGSGGGNVAPIGSIGTAPQNVTPIKGGNAKNAATVNGITSQTALVDAVLKQLRSRELTPEVAWQNGALTIDDVLLILEKHIDQWGGFFYKKDESLRRALTKLLVQNGGEKLKDTSKFSPWVRLWLADYYGSIGDKRVLELAESVLHQSQPNLKSEEMLAFQAIERICWHWRLTKEYEKSAQMWLKTSALFDQTSWMAWDARWSAALDYKYAGKNEQSIALLNLVINSQQYTFAGLAALCATDYDQTPQDYAQAIKTLSQIVTPNNQSPVLVTVLSRLGQLYARQGDKGRAISAFERSVELSEKVILSELPPSLVSVVDEASSASRFYLSLLRGGNLGICYPDSLKIEIGKGENKTLVRTFILRTLHPVSVSWSSEQIPVSIVPTGRNWTDDIDGKGYCQEYRVQLTLFDKVKNQDHKTMILKGVGQIGGVIDLPLVLKTKVTTAIK